MMETNEARRQNVFKQMKKGPLDILVIGGGITGSGIALDAASRGLKTAVLEMQDFAAGTSSRSTKLVHGGLRYLKQLEVKLVAEVGKERAIVYENGPHITTPEWMLLPFYKGGTFGPYSTNVGLRVYDFLAGVKKKERREMLSPTEALAKEPLIKQDELKGAGYYVEYKTDDARLTIEVLKKAVSLGALAANYAKVVDFIYDQSDQVAGVMVENRLNGETHKMYAKKIINAAGPWVDELREVDGSKEGKTLHLTKGVHLVFSQDVFPLRQAIYFDTPDGRMLFAIPRDNKTYVGTTDTDYTGDISHPVATVKDRDYILDAIHYIFPSVKVDASDVESSWAGVRPLISDGEGKNPGEISRKDEIFISDSGLISMAGGKLTGYRKMAQEAVDVVVQQLKEETNILYSKSETEHIPVAGGDVGGSKGFTAFVQQQIKIGESLGLETTIAEKLVKRYGSEVIELFRLYQDKKSEAEAEGIDPVVLAELSYSMAYEFVQKPVDFFIRRTGALFFDIDWVKKHQEPVIRYMSKKFSWKQYVTDAYQKELTKLLKEAQFQ
ncbi:glycerol-3-phosphate dehydrogenase/oxidase [Ornithinibacillus gellani]|uniref:glycerol-3-phosphate dehydrogenase/oxidase n=1 Tax=Ornithinibacillus gellani TaxID=2293253 RepID=UPI0037C659CD